MKNSKVCEVMRMLLVYSPDQGVVLKAHPPAADGSQLVDVKRFGYHRDEVFTSIPVGDFGEVPAGNPLGVYCTYNEHQTRQHAKMAAEEQAGGRSVYELPDFAGGGK